MVSIWFLLLPDVSSAHLWKIERFLIKEYKLLQFDRKCGVGTFICGKQRPVKC